MSGVWVFKNGVIQIGETSTRRKVLVHLPTGQAISSYSSLEQILGDLGWERYYGGDPDLFQFHKSSSIDLISLPRDFSRFSSVHMYDIVVKNPNIFHVRDIYIWVGRSIMKVSDLFQFHKRSSIDLISLPRDFFKFSSVHINIFSLKAFHVRDM